MKKIEIIFIIIIFLTLVVGMCFLFSLLKSNGYECVNDPINYAAKENNATCYCMKGFKVAQSNFQWDIGN